MVTTKSLSREPTSSRKPTKNLVNQLPSDTSQHYETEENDVFYTPMNKVENGGNDTLIKDQEYFTPCTKRRENLPLRKKEGKSRKTHIVVEIPLKSVSPQTKVDQELQINRELNTVADKHIDKAGGSNLVVSSLVSTKAKASPNATTPTRHRLRSHEFNAEGLASNNPTSELPDLDDENSDSDGPEIVASQDALQLSRSRNRDLLRAAQSQASIARKKRQERETFLKDQAAKSSKKRKRGQETEDEAAKHSLQAVSSASNVACEDGNNKSEAVKSISIEHAGEASTQNVYKFDYTFDPNNLPDLLPLDFLKGNEKKDIPAFTTQSHKKTAPKQNKMKSLRLSEDGQRDHYQGNTIYRITKPVDNPTLAPKASSQARFTKESWLSGRSGKLLGSSRKPFRSGFFVAKR